MILYINLQCIKCKYSLSEEWLNVYYLLSLFKHSCYLDSLSSCVGENALHNLLMLLIVQRVVRWWWLLK